jgi:MFS family permease
MYAGGGRMLDLVGTRRGFIFIMLWWSVACALHGLATSFGFLLLARCLLGMGEGGAFPAAARVVAEWVPLARRSTAMGIINAGTAVGSVLARHRPPHQRMAHGLLRIGRHRPALGRMVGEQLSRQQHRIPRFA